MIAFGGFFQKVQILFEFLVCREADAIDAFEHLILFVAPPVCTGAFQKLHGLYLAGGADMRSATEIYKIPLSIGAYHLIFWDFAKDLDLIHLVHASKHLDCFSAAQLLTIIGQILSAQFFHALFNFLQIFVAEGFFPIKIVVKTLLNGWTDGNLNIRPELFYCLCHQVSGAMPIELFAFVRLKCMYY